MADNFTDGIAAELAFNSPIQPVEPEIKWSWPTYEVQREYFDRRDDSLRARKFARHLDTFRQVAPDDRDIQRLAERHGARYLMIQVCANGTPQANRTVWREVIQDARVIGAEQPTHTTNAPPAPPALPLEHSAAAKMNETVEILDATERLFNKMTPTKPALSADDIRKIVGDTMREAMAQSQPAAPAAPPLDPLTMVREVAKLQKELAPPAPPAPQIDPAEQFKRQLETYKDLSELVNPIREHDDGARGVFGNIVGIIGDVVKIGKEAAPVLMPFIMRGSPQQQTEAAAQPAAQGDAPPEPTPAAPVNPAVPVLAIIIEDLKRNKRVGRAADEIEGLIKSDEQYAPMFQAMLAKPEREILRELSQVAGEDLTGYSHGEAWIEDLVLELTPEDGDGETDESQGDTPNIVNMASARAS